MTITTVIASDDWPPRDCQFVREYWARKRMRKLWAKLQAEIEKLAPLEQEYARDELDELSDCKTYRSSAQSLLHEAATSNEQLYKFTKGKDKNGRPVLSPRQQQALDLWAKHYTRKKAAKEMGMKPGAYKTLLQRARAQQSKIEKHSATI